MEESDKGMKEQMENIAMNSKTEKENMIAAAQAYTDRISTLERTLQEQTTRSQEELVNIQNIAEEQRMSIETTMGDKMNEVQKKIILGSKFKNMIRISRNCLNA